MRAVVLREYGGPERLVLEDVVRPEPAPDEAVVRVRACGVCHLDLILRSGMRSRVKLPTILGHELAGEVVEVGRAVTRVVPGDRVASANHQGCGACRYCRRGRISLCLEPRGEIGQVRPGGYAEYVALPEANLVRVPPTLPLEHAALAACCFTPPYKALRHMARVRPGETVLVTGVSGGLGMATVQLARLSGARTIGVTTSETKADEVRKLGVDEVVVDRAGSFGDEVRRLTDGVGAEVVIDTVGSPLFPGTLRALARGGRYVILGELAGEAVDLNLALVILKEWEVFGVQSASPAELEEVLHFLDKARLEPVIMRRLPLEAVADAHHKLAERKVVGRMLVVP